MVEVLGHVTGPELLVGEEVNQGRVVVDILGDLVRDVGGTVRACLVGLNGVPGRELTSCR